ncbi:Uncharacterised protein [uncultured archaeon]|nr:Uncharacterised protein [uncultured archaeon]
MTTPKNPRRLPFNLLLSFVSRLPMLQRLSPSDLVQGLYTGSLNGGGPDALSLHVSFMSDKLGDFQGVLEVLFAFVDSGAHLALARWLVEGAVKSLPS